MTNGRTSLQRLIDHVVAEIQRSAPRIEAAADAKDPAAAPGPLAVSIALVGGDVIAAGAAATRFPLQSIAKVLALDLALDTVGDDLFARVGREPSGDPFDSIVELERNAGIPRNPFVNAGALVIVDLLCANPRAGSVTDLVRRQLDGEAVPLDEAVMATEQRGGDLNRAMLNFLRHHGNLMSDPDEVMRRYIEQCALSLDCRALARACRFLARTGLNETDDAQRHHAERRRRILALMMTCGQYDGSGDFAMRIGLPAKSGVGGGLVAIVPEIASIAVWSPNLDQNGNSILGVRALEMIVSETGWSVFGPALSASPVSRAAPSMPSASGTGYA